MENEYGIHNTRVRIVSSANEFRSAENDVIAAAESLRDALPASREWTPEEAAVASAVDCLRQRRAVREAAGNA